MTTKKNTNKKNADNKAQTGEERFIATGKSVTLLKPGKGSKANSGGKKGK